MNEDTITIKNENKTLECVNNTFFPLTGQKKSIFFYDKSQKNFFSTTQK